MTENHDKLKQLRLRRFIRSALQLQNFFLLSFDNFVNLTAEVVR